MTDEEEVVSPHEEAAEVVADMQENVSADIPGDILGENETQREDHVPLSKFIKERKKRQELEQRYHELAKAQSQKEDNSMYETATKQDLGQTQQEIIKVVEERQWIRNNPEKYERLQANLQDFLEQRPHLAAAIREAPNRWEEAYALMEALTPRQQQTIRKEPVRKVAPNAPTSVPKSAGIKEAEDVMHMTDAEYRDYVKAAKLKAKRR